MTHSSNRRFVNFFSFILNVFVLFTFAIQPIAIDNNQVTAMEKKEEYEDAITDKQKYEAYQAEHSQKDATSSNQIIVRVEQGCNVQEILNKVSQDVRADIDINTARKLDDRGIFVINTSGANKDGIVQELNQTAGIIYAQPNFKLITSSFDTNQSNWGLNNKGQTIEGIAGISGIDVNISDAWNKTRGSQDVIVGVLDTGIDISHESIAGRTVPGWDFVNQDDSVYDLDVIDKHGTYVASIIAGSSSTMTGVAPNIKIMPLKAFTYNYGYTADIIDAIHFAKQNGVKIINCSFAAGDYNSALAEVMNDSDMLFVCAAGNYAVNTSDYVTFPACFALDNIVSVAAVTNTGELADFTTYGDKITLSAPGKSILGAVPENQYETKSGTSASAAYVSGAAALMLSQNRELNVYEMKQILQNSAIKSARAMAISGIQPEEFKLNPLLDITSALNYNTPDFTKVTPEVEQENLAAKEVWFEAVNESEVKIHFSSEKAFDSAHVVVAKDQTVYTNTDIAPSSREFSISDLSALERYTYNIVFSNGIEREDWLGTFQIIHTENSVAIHEVLSSKQSYQAPQDIEAHAVRAQKDDVLQSATFELQAGDITPFSTDRYEQENNNSLNLADRMYDGDNMWGAISSSTDVDYYKISFSTSGVANFWLGNIPSDCYYTFQILNSSGTILSSAGNAPYTTANRYNFNVTAGTTYYIKVFSALDTYSSSKYLLRAKWYSEKDEFEDNDSLETAKAIFPNDGLRILQYATINHPYDYDYYKFTIEQDMYTTVTFRTAENTRYEFRLMDENLSSFIDTSTTIDSNHICMLPAGTYYFQVNSTEDVGGYSAEEYFIGMEFAPLYTLSEYNSTRIETMSPNGVYFEVPFINNPRGVEFILTNPSGVNYDMFLYEGYETEIASAVTKKETEKISLSLTFGGYLLRVDQAFGVHNLEDFTLQTKYITVGNSSELFNNGDSIPERMEAGTSKAVGVAATNTGANIWTKESGYSLRATGQNSLFGVGANQNLSDSDAVQYSKAAAFYFNLTAPIPTSNINTYSLGWRMQQNGVAFGDTLTADIDVFDPETLNIDTKKTISGPTEKWYKITFPTAGAYAIRTYDYSLGCDTDLEIWSETLGGVSFCEDANDVSATNLYSKLTVTQARANQTVFLQVKEHTGSNLYTQIEVTKIHESTIEVGETVSVEDVTEGYIKFTPPSDGTYVFYTSRSANGPDCDTYLTLRYNVLDYIVLAENDDVGALGENDENYSGALYSKVIMYVNSTAVYIQPTSYDYYKCGKNSKTNCTVTVEKLSDENIVDRELNIMSPSNNSKVPVGSTLKITGSRPGYKNISVTVDGVKLSGMTTTNHNFEVDYVVNSIKNYNIVLSGTSVADNTVVSKSITIQGVANITPGSGFDYPTVLAEGASRTFDIDTNEDAHFFSFTPSETGSYIIKSMDVPGENLLDMAAELYDTDKTTIIDQSDNAPDSVNFMLARTLVKDKKYYIKAFTSPIYQSGKYTIMAQKLDEPNDAKFENQWGLLNKGLYNWTYNDPIYDHSEVAGIDINVLPAWQYTKGEGVTVAVVDSGVDPAHEDLNGNFLPGYNYVHNSNDLYPSSEPALSNPNIDSSTAKGHGTHVSGIIAAESDPDSSTNSGIVGVAPKAKVLPVKSLGNIYDANGIPKKFNTEANLSKGMTYAVDNGADIVNLSVQGYAAEIETTMEVNPDTLFVVCAGNYGTDLSDPANEHYPASAEGDNILTIANMRGDGELDPSSCYGGPTQLAAPGTEIFSTKPSNQYDYMTGTSMAAPHVSGVAALLLSYNPSLTAQDLRSRIVSNVTVSDKLNNKVSSGGYLNAFRALTNENDTVSLLNIFPLSIQEKADRKKSLSNQSLLLKSAEEKTNEIFVNFIDVSNADEVLNTLLNGINYTFIEQMEATDSYLLAFDTVADAENAITILNNSNDIYYSCMNCNYIFN